GALAALDGQNGSIIWTGIDVLGNYAGANYNAAGVGHFLPGSNLQLAVLPLATDPVLHITLSPSYLLLYDLGATTLTPPCPMLRNNGQNSAVARPDGFSTQLITVLYQGALGRPPSSGELSTIWLPALQHAPSLRPAILAILSSPEARIHLIN